MKQETILILGGTKEASELAQNLVAEKPSARVIVSLAGRTKEPRPTAGETRVGGFGGAQGLADYLIEQNVTKLIDATHPFARRISQNARIASQRSGTPLEARTRPPWQKTIGDDWHSVTDLQAASDAIPTQSHVLLALGSQHIDIFRSRSDVHFLVRMVDPPGQPLPFANYTLLIGKPGDVAHECEVLTAHEIDHIICRNSGGAGAYSKIEAARILNLKVIMIDR